MWFNKNSLFPAFWSESATPLRGRQQKGVNQNNFYFNLIGITEPLQEAGGHLVSFTPTTECLILVVMKRSEPRLVLHSASPLWNDPWEEGGGCFTCWPISWSFFIGIHWGEWWVSWVTLAAFRAQEQLPMGLCVHGFAHQLSSSFVIQFCAVFDLLWSSVISSNIIYLCSKSLLKLVARLVLMMSVNLGF